MPDKMYIYITLTHLLWAFVEGNYEFDSQDMKHLIDVGKTQYDIVNDKGSLPVYGLCWKSAVANLHQGCKHLNEASQSNIALRFTDCFLITSGHEPFNCEAKLDLRKECLTGMSDRAFMAYTEFYTHTQNICFYLQSQIWREETEMSIQKLSKTSKQVTEQLEKAEEMQSVLLEHQQETIIVQKELLGNGESLNEILLNSHNSLHDIMSEFRTSTFEQKKMLFDVFERLSSLQAWAVGEISWLDSVVFYFVSAVVSYVITATPHSQGARLWIFLAISINVLIERTVCTYLLQDTYSEINAFNENLHWWVWLCRKLLVVVCALMLGMFIYMYRDFNVANHELLLKIHKQNQDLVDQLKMIDTSIFISPIKNDYSSLTDTHKDAVENNFNSSFSTSTPVIEDYRESTFISETIDEPRQVTPQSISPSPTPSRSSKTSNSSQVGISKGRQRGASQRRPIIEITSTTRRYMLRSFDKEETPTG